MIPYFQENIKLLFRVGNKNNPERGVKIYIQTFLLQNGTKISKNGEFGILVIFLWIDKTFSYHFIALSCHSVFLLNDNGK